MNKNSSDNLSALDTFLTQLGFTVEEKSIYTALVTRGSMTILELSKAAGVNRTKIYRLLDELKKRGIILEVVEEYKTVLKAAEIHNLEQLVKEQEAKAALLRESFPHVVSMLHPMMNLQQPGTEVIMYRGVEGIKQMIWNTLEAKSEIVGYTYREMDELVGETYDQSWREEFKARDLSMRDIYSDVYLESIKGKKDNQLVSDLKFESRYIAEKHLTINHQIDIYNDIVAFYSWQGEEIYGVEIHNAKLAQMQRQMFEIVWNISKRSKL
ncbi:MAG: TrmB family transcriptional regulator [Weeksellaceae bacterium]